MKVDLENWEKEADDLVSETKSQLLLHQEVVRQDYLTIISNKITGIT